MKNKPSILIIDDEAQMRRLVQLTLQNQDYRTILAINAQEGLLKAKTERPDLIILDLGLPDKDGLDVLREFRAWSTIPVIVLSVRNSEGTIVSCLEAGADDYLTKPFRSGELAARVRTALRHRPTILPSAVFTSGTLSVDLDARLVRKADHVLKLTAIEFSLLSLFIRNAGRVLTHRYLLEQVWGPDFVDETQYTRVYVGQLRKKIEDDPAKPAFIVTESRIGYRFVSEE